MALHVSAYFGPRSEDGEPKPFPYRASATTLVCAVLLYVLGSKDGLIAERIDENLPYIDQGYVADDAGPDLSKALGDALGGLFGKKDDQR